MSKINIKICFVLALCLLSGIPSFGTTDSICLQVRVLSNHTIRQISIQPVKGNYRVNYKNNAGSDLPLKTTVSASVNGKKVKLIKAGNVIGSFDTLKISSTAKDGIIRVKAGKVERKYDDGLVIYITKGNLCVINRVDLEDYTAGVVLSEAGDAKVSEFFKLQCLISRTYALKNIRKHEQQGFQLCDLVHCQLYHGHNFLTEIDKALENTRGLVILGPDSQLISAAFHSNSGGETTNSENVWSLPAPYLKGVEDTFSLSMPMATWEKKIDKKKWINHLKNKYHFPVHNKELLDSALSFRQEHRKVYYVNNIPLKELRNDFQLRSTYFDITDQGEILRIRGKGYGHGVGLSQQGALRMAMDGYPFTDILKHYYKEVSISSVDTTMIPRKK